MTRTATIAAFLSSLEQAKERGIVATEIAIPAWTGEDSDERKEECGGCGTAESPDIMNQCPHCGVWFCHHVEADCYEAHREGLRMRRR